eukprot:CAMPEP_0168773982 /NCGR_PEP_ID=MMETSP0725-20121227/4758_1 /TAXON_ID=265536 /ORGANISM="Amphiprora sp., Strain CCMP467" /LENGTH=214 /DNA_ID=CAMNT_0008823559 /DNA_START=112 /DNA_END=754 /DNA_ORIENTATION=-
MTTVHSVYGSYNLSCAARCANWESIRVSALQEEDIEFFDQHWDALEDRSFPVLYPDTFPSRFRIDGGKRAQLNDNNTLKPCGQTSTRPDLPPPNKDIRNRALCTNQSFAWRNNTKETKEQIQAAGPAEVAAVTNNNDPAEEKDRVCLCWKLLRQITETANLATLDPAVERTYKLCDNSVYLGVSCSPDFAQCIMDDLFRSLEDVHCYLDDFGAW